MKSAEIDHSGGIRPVTIGRRARWLHYLLIALVIEKIVQHMFVTLAFHFDWAAIGATVAVYPSAVMTLGAVVTVLFALALSGLVHQAHWATNLIIGLAVFDILGEFAAQGRFDIVITLSFLVAVALLLLAISYRKTVSQLSSSRPAALGR